MLLTGVSALAHDRQGLSHALDSDRLPGSLFTLVAHPPSMAFRAQ